MMPVWFHSSGRANVDDGHSLLSQLLEPGDVDLEHLGAKAARSRRGGRRQRVSTSALAVPADVLSVPIVGGS